MAKKKTIVGNHTSPFFYRYLPTLIYYNIIMPGNCKFLYTTFNNKLMETQIENTYNIYLCILNDKSSKFIRVSGEHAFSFGFFEIKIRL